MLDSDTTGFWDHHRSELPKTLKFPEVLLDQHGEPRYRLVDSMGIAHELRDGGSLRDARFENYCLAGLRLRDVTWTHVVWDGCELNNMELDGNLTRVGITGGSPGLIVRNGVISDLYISGGTPGSILRFSNCKMRNITLTHSKIAFELSRCVVEDLHVENTDFSQPSIIQRSTITIFKLMTCTFNEVNQKDVVWNNGVISHSTFSNSKWANVDISLTDISFLQFTHLEVLGLRADGSSWRSCRSNDSIAKNVEWNHCDVMALEWFGGRFSVTIKHTSCDGMVFWRAGMFADMARSRISGLRANDCAVYLSGRTTRLTNPVMRRSHVMGTMGEDVIVSHAEAWSSMISEEIGGTWVDCNGGPTSTTDSR